MLRALLIKVVFSSIFIAQSVQAQTPSSAPFQDANAFVFTNQDRALFDWYQRQYEGKRALDATIARRSDELLGQSLSAVQRLDRNVDAFWGAVQKTAFEMATTALSSLSKENVAALRGTPRPGGSLDRFFTAASQALRNANLSADRVAMASERIAAAKKLYNTLRAFNGRINRAVSDYEASLKQAGLGRGDPPTVDALRVEYEGYTREIQGALFIAGEVARRLPAGTPYKAQLTIAATAMKNAAAITDSAVRILFVNDAELRNLEEERTEHNRILPHVERGWVEFFQRERQTRLSNRLDELTGLLARAEAGLRAGRYSDGFQRGVFNAIPGLVQPFDQAAQRAGYGDASLLRAHRYGARPELEKQAARLKRFRDALASYTTLLRREQATARAEAAAELARQAEARERQREEERRRQEARRRAADVVLTPRFNELTQFTAHPEAAGAAATMTRAQGQTQCQPQTWLLSNPRRGLTPTFFPIDPIAAMVASGGRGVDVVAQFCVRSEGERIIQSRQRRPLFRENCSPPRPEGVTISTTAIREPIDLGVQWRGPLAEMGDNRFRVTRHGRAVFESARDVTEWRRGYTGETHAVDYEYYAHPLCDSWFYRQDLTRTQAIGRVYGLVATRTYRPRAAFDLWASESPRFVEHSFTGEHRRLRDGQYFYGRIEDLALEADLVSGDQRRVERIPGVRIEKEILAQDGFAQRLRLRAVEPHGGAELFAITILHAPTFRLALDVDAETPENGVPALRAGETYTATLEAVAKLDPLARWGVAWSVSTPKIQLDSTTALPPNPATDLNASATTLRVSPDCAPGEHQSELAEYRRVYRLHTNICAASTLTAQVLRDGEPFGEPATLNVTVRTRPIARAEIRVSTAGGTPRAIRGGYTVTHPIAPEGVTILQRGAASGVFSLAFIDELGNERTLFDAIGRGRLLWSLEPRTQAILSRRDFGAGTLRVETRPLPAFARIFASATPASTVEDNHTPNFSDAFEYAQPNGVDFRIQLAQLTPVEQGFRLAVIGAAPAAAMRWRSGANSGPLEAARSGVLEAIIPRVGLSEGDEIALIGGRGDTLAVFRIDTLGDDAFAPRVILETFTEPTVEAQRHYPIVAVVDGVSGDESNLFVCRWSSSHSGDFQLGRFQPLRIRASDGKLACLNAIRFAAPGPAPEVTVELVRR